MGAEDRFRHSPGRAGSTPRSLARRLLREQLGAVERVRVTTPTFDTNPVSSPLAAPFGIVLIVAGVG